MSKQTLVVDIDDVLAANAEGFIAFSNERWGTNLTVEDYDERFSLMWNIDHEESERRAHEFFGSGATGKYRHDESALSVLKELKQRYRLIIVTSRRLILQKETLAWIDKYFTGIFEDVDFAGFWDGGQFSGHKQNKADLLAKLGAAYLIDDQPKHCVPFAEAGGTSLLFGDYPWNRTAKEVKGMVRTGSWAAVKEYFDGR